MTEINDSVFKSAEFAGFLFNNLSSAIFLVDSALRVQKVNDAYQTLFSRDENEILNNLCGNALGCSFAVEQGQLCGETNECANCTIRGCLLKGFSKTGEVQTTYINRSFYIDGKPVFKYFRMKTRTVDWNGTIMAIIAVDDITELEEQKQRIEDLANRDYLTGLYNRRYFFSIAGPLFSNAKRGNTVIAVAMFDIDFFKQINDAYGHAAGDFVIKTIADIFRSQLRSADIVARFGGEEFCVLLQCSKVEDAFLVTDKIRLAIDAHEFKYEASIIPVTISAGLTAVLEEDLDAMIRRADSLLYRAKEAGRNRTEEYRILPLG